MCYISQNKVQSRGRVRARNGKFVAIVKTHDKDELEKYKKQEKNLMIVVEYICKGSISVEYEMEKDPVQELNEACSKLNMKREWKPPRRVGTNHVIELCIDQVSFGKGNGFNKKEAEKDIAMRVLKKWKLLQHYVQKFLV